jgi:hypothetical protein
MTDPTATPPPAPLGQSATGSNDPELQAKMAALDAPLRWKRAIEVTLYEDEIHALARYIAKQPGRMREEEAIQKFITEGLVRAQCVRL